MPRCWTFTHSLCLVGFAGFVRCSELAQLKESDVVICPEHMELFVEASKTDQFQDGAWVVIARTQSKFCPVAMMERYSNMAAIETHGDQFLCSGLVNTKTGAWLWENGGLSYTRSRELILDKLAAIRLDRRQFGPHSLCAGGASAAANA